MSTEENTGLLHSGGTISAQRLHAAPLHGSRGGETVWAYGEADLLLRAVRSAYVGNSVHRASVRKARWDQKYLRLARFVGEQWSKDPSTKVGAVIANEDGRVTLGYNGFPRGVEDTEKRLNDRDLKYKLVVHAETNALLNLGGPAPAGSTLYTWPFPACERCAGNIVQAGIKRVVSIKPDNERMERWKSSFQLADIIFQEAGVTQIVYPSDFLEESIDSA